jgi:hypothetical protein
MKMILFKILVVAAVIVAVLYIIGAYEGKNHIKREIMMNETMEKVYNYVCFYKKSERIQSMAEL